MPKVLSHDVEIYYEIHGEGEDTLVFAHGMGGNAAIWYQQIAAFYKDYRIVTFDHRYFARSSCSSEKFDPKKFPDDVLAILDAEDIQAAVFVCQSMGGWTGSQVALKHPQRIKALVMSHTPGVFFSPEISSQQDVSDLIAKIGGGFSSPALAYDFPEKKPKAAVLYQLVSNFNGIDNAVIPQKIGEAKLGVDIANIESYCVPTLFITGDLDVLFPASYIEAIAAKVPGAQCINLGAVGHSSYFESADEFNNTLLTFLRGLEGLQA